MCVHTRVCGGQAGGDTGRLPDHPLWVFWKCRDPERTQRWTPACLHLSPAQVQGSKVRLQDSCPGLHTSLVPAREGPRCLLPREVMSHVPLPLSPTAPARLLLVPAGQLGGLQVHASLLPHGAHSCPEPRGGKKRGGEGRVKAAWATSGQPTAWSRYWRYWRREGMLPRQTATPNDKSCPLAGKQGSPGEEVHGTERCREWRGERREAGEAPPPHGRMQGPAPPAPL